MGKQKKKHNKHKKVSSSPADPQTVIDRLRKENDILRARLEKIAELTRDLPEDPDEHPDELIVNPDHEVNEGASLVAPAES
jgi:hypothetical protein